MPLWEIKDHNGNVRQQWRYHLILIWLSQRTKIYSSSTTGSHYPDLETCLTSSAIWFVSFNSQLTSSNHRKSSLAVYFVWILFFCFLKWSTVQGLCVLEILHKTHLNDPVFNFTPSYLWIADRCLKKNSTWMKKKQRAFSLVKVAYYDCLIDEKSWKFKA